MANVKFYLKEKNSISKTLILLAFNYNNQRFKYSSKISINPKHWDSIKFRVKSQVAHSLKFNTQLKKIEEGILNIYHSIISNEGAINNSILKERLNIYLNRQEKEDFFSYVKLYIEQKDELRETTKRDYLQTYNTLKEFEKKTSYLVSFETINLDFYNRLKNYVLKSLNHSKNTFGKRIKTIKSIMSFATEMGVNNNLEFQKKAFKVISEKAKHVYLTIEEINKLQKLNLNGIYEITNDAFLLMCYLGLRYSDYKNINRNNISDDYLDITMHKTNEDVSIPIHPNALEIIKKYNYFLPKITNSNLNKNIKKVCRYAEIDELIIDRDKKFHKYELIMCHTARRSFATNGYLSDVPIRDLMRIIGHKKETTFLNYVQVKRDVKLSRILEIYPTELKKAI